MITMNTKMASTKTARRREAARMIALYERQTDRRAPQAVRRNPKLAAAAIVRALILTRRPSLRAARRPDRLADTPETTRAQDRGQRLLTRLVRRRAARDEE